MIKPHVAEMKKDVCARIDALCEFVEALDDADEHKKLKEVAAAVVALGAARFCSSVDVLLCNDLDDMRAIVAEEVQYRMEMENSAESNGPSLDAN